MFVAHLVQQVPLKIELRDMLSEKPQELRVLWVHAPDRVRRVTQDKLRYFARRMTVTSRGG